MRDRLFHEILMARERVYAVGGQTPLVRVPDIISGELYLKREDLSLIHSYKWRGAYNRMATLSEEERTRGIVAASAGNHGQGVALAAQRLGIDARVYMPYSTPRMKQRAVAQHGGDRVEIVLHGDDYDSAAELALADVKDSGSVFIHPYDDFGTMGGQGTLADEVVMSGEGPFDAAYVQIGGGGLAASVACWLKAYYPKIYIVGVEGVDQASMAAAVEAGRTVRLDYVDVFCDGTAVKQAGENTFPLCAGLIDEFITVTNEQVCAAIQQMWEALRCVPEPAGAMGLAGVLKHRARLDDKKVLAIICGANMDFGQLAWIGSHAAIGAARTRYFRCEIGERPGAMLELLESAMEGINIIDMQYGKIHSEKAWPVLAFEASPMDLDVFSRRLSELDIPHEDVTSEEDVEFRIIHYEPQLFSHPHFIKLEFPERPGALRDFLVLHRNTANLCYFNYVFTGEQVGHALIGFEFESQEKQSAFKQDLQNSPYAYQELSQTVLKRIL